jgi:hypothetical protein
MSGTIRIPLHPVYAFITWKEETFPAQFINTEYRLLHTLNLLVCLVITWKTLKNSDILRVFKAVITNNDFSLAFLY